MRDAGVGDGDGEGVGGVDGRRLGELQHGRDHEADLALVGEAVADDRALDQRGRVLAERDAGALEQEQHDAASVTELGGRLGILAEEQVLDAGGLGAVRLEHLAQGRVDDDETLGERAIDGRVDDAVGDVPHAGSLGADQAPAEMPGARVIGPRGLFTHPSWATPWPELDINDRNSIAYTIALVASGGFDASVTLSGKSDWDIAAADLIIAEAGGHATDHLGNRFRYNQPVTRHLNAISAGPVLHDWLVDKLREFKPPEKTA